MCAAAVIVAARTGNFMEAFVRYTKFLRVKLGLSQQKLSLRSGVRQPIISDIETGRSVPTIAEADALARVLGCDPTDLLKHVDAAPLGDGVEFRDAQREVQP
jgi:transcriptional regulator with XRE-family HTH domain